MDPGFPYSSTGTAGVELEGIFAAPALQVQANGQVVVAGSFMTRKRGQTQRPPAIRLNADGTVDPALSIDAEGNARSIVARPDGRVLLLSELQLSIEGITRPLAQLSAKGALDVNFAPEFDVLALEAIILQPDGRVIVAGAFTSVDGVPRKGLVRLLDSEQSDSNIVSVLVPHPRVLEANTNVIANVFRAGDPSRQITVWLSTEGGTAIMGRDYMSAAQSLTFAAGERRKTISIPLLDNTVLQTNSTIFVRLLTPSPGVGLGAQASQEITILDDDTFRFMEDQFRVDESCGEFDVAVVSGSPQGNFLVSYETADGSAKAGSDYLSRTGTLQFSAWWQDAGYRTFQVPIRDNHAVDGDRTFTVTLRNPTSGLPMGPNSSATITILDNDTHAGPGKGFNGTIHAALGLSNGRILVGGWFTSVDGLQREFIARLHPDGTIDPDFETAPAPNDAVTALAADTDGTILIGGRFTEVAGVARGHIARLKPDGALESSFDPGAGWSGFAGLFDALDTIHSIVVQPDGRILTGGSFTNFNGVNQGGLARLLPNGTLDPAFVPQLQTPVVVRALALQPDGAILVACNVPPYSYQDQVLRLNPDGTLDEFWTPFRMTRVLTLRLLSNSQVLVGHFGYAGFSRGVLRLQADGTPDPAFDTSLNFETLVHDLVELQDGTILAAGRLQLSYEPQTGRSTWANVVRLTSSGRLDPAFSPALNSPGPARTLVLQPDNRIFAGGTFNGLDAERVMLERRDPGFGTAPYYRPTPYAYHWLLLEPDGRFVADHSFDGVVRLPSGWVELSILAQPALPLGLEASGNLRQWTPIVGPGPHRVLRYSPGFEPSRHFFRMSIARTPTPSTIELTR